MTIMMWLVFGSFYVAAAVTAIEATVSYDLVKLSTCKNGCGFTAELQLANSSTPSDEDLQPLVVSVRLETSDRVHVHITTGGEAGAPRWEVPTSILPRLTLNASSVCSPCGNKGEQQRALKVHYTQRPFGFAVSRAAGGEVLFNTTPPPDSPLPPLLFQDQYLELSSSLPPPPAHALFGLGESTRSAGLKLQPASKYTLFAADTRSNSLDTNLYGVHPFYMDVRGSGSAHGVFLFNSNGMDVVYEERSITYKVIGGVMDFYIFAGPSPLDVVRQYTDVIGKPAFQPYWSLGWHQSHWGYNDVASLQQMVDGYASAHIPLDGVWSDIDYMEGFKDFTLQPTNFSEGQVEAFIDTLHKRGQKYVLILDPGIKLDSSYPPYSSGLTSNVFVKNSEGDPYIGQVWPGPCVFPDFMHPNATSYWTAFLGSFHETVPYDGIWIDMNEPANFCTGTLCTVSPSSPCPAAGPVPHSPSCCLDCNPSVTVPAAVSVTVTARYDNPPYTINHMSDGRILGWRTIAMSAVHYGGVVAYNAHNLYGFTEAMVTGEALRSITKKRPFVLSRSTFSGSGAHAAHWTGDNGATWDDLAYSVVQILNFGLFGIPMVGADICGYQGDTTEELCNRWMSVGAFYPFSRVHNDKWTPPSVPYRWPSVEQAARNAIQMRYRLLPYLYSLTYEAHFRGTPIARPLFFAHPSDITAVGIDRQFYLGPSLMVSPVMDEGARHVDAYFPRGSWWSLWDYSHEVTTENGTVKRVDAPLGHIPVHIRGGSIVPMQQGGMTVRESRATPVSLVIAFDGNAGGMGGDVQVASGFLYLDDGEDGVMEGGNSSVALVSFSAVVDGGGKGHVGAHWERDDFVEKLNMTLGSVTVLGVGKGLNSTVLRSKYQVQSSHVEEMEEGFRVKVDMLLVHFTNLSWTLS